MTRHTEELRHEKYHGLGKTPSLATFLLKRRGHEIIDTIERDYCVERERIYFKLGKRMGNHMLAHFSHVDDIHVLNRMVRHLEEMLEVKRNRGPQVKAKPKIERDYSRMFTDKKVLREVGLRNQIRVLSTWRKWLLWLGAILPAWHGKTRK